MPDTMSLGPLLNVLAQSLDLQEIFAQLSELARQTVPQDLLHFGLVSEDHTRIRLIALSAPFGAAPLEVPLSEQARQTLEVDAAIVHHVRGRPGAEWTLEGLVWNFATASDGPWRWQPDPGWKAILDGYQSWLRLRVSLRGGVLGFINFFSRHPNPYSAADLTPARRIADLLGLAFAHERLAQEQRRHAEAREREARLEARVARLKAELEAVGGYRAVGASKPWHEVLAQAAKVAATETTVLLTGESERAKEVSGAADSPRIASRRCAIRGRELRRAARERARIRVVRTRAGSVHRSGDGASGRLEQAAGHAVSRWVGEMSTAGAG
jgi:GAF domain-containing protein